MTLPGVHFICIDSSGASTLGPSDSGAVGARRSRRVARPGAKTRGARARARIEGERDEDGQKERRFFEGRSLEASLQASELACWEVN